MSCGGPRLTKRGSGRRVRFRGDRRWTSTKVGTDRGIPPYSGGGSDMKVSKGDRSHTLKKCTESPHSTSLGKRSGYLEDSRGSHGT